MGVVRLISSERRNEKEESGRKDEADNRVVFVKHVTPLSAPTAQKNDSNLTRSLMSPVLWSGAEESRMGSDSSCQHTSCPFAKYKMNI